MTGNHSSYLKRGFAVLLSLLLLLSAVPFAFAESADRTIAISLDFCEGHEELAAMFAAYLETEAEGSVVSFPITEGMVSDVTDALYGLMYESGVWDALGENGKDNGEQFERLSLKPLSDYADQDEYYDELNSHWETPIVEGDTLYAGWKQPVKNVNVTITPPVCGTVVEWANDSHPECYSGNTPHTHPSPEITVTGDAVLFHNPYHGGAYAQGVYVDNAEGNMAYSSIDQDGYFQGTIEGGKNYYVAFQLDASFGHYIDEDCFDAITINGEAPVNQNYGSYVVGVVRAIHQGIEITEVQAPTCTEPGVGNTFCNGCNTPLNNVPIDPIGHRWSAPVWDWAEDGTSATAVFSCANGDHPENAEATVTLLTDESSPVTCTADGNYSYTATVTFYGQTYTSNKNVTIPSAGHDYEAVWNWADDCSLAVVTLTCKAGDTEPVEKSAAITEAKTEPTATEDGAVTYTATATVNGKTYTDIKTKVLPAIGSPDTPQGDKLCKWCGEPHNGFFGKIIGFFHSVLYFFAHLFG